MRYQEILKRIENKKTAYVTKDGDNLLHLLLRLELQEKISLPHVQKLLEQNPKLINTENKAGLLPTDILDEIQIRGRPSNRPLRRLLYTYMWPSVKKDRFLKSFKMSFMEYKQNGSFDYVDLPIQSGEELFNKPCLVCFSGRGGFSLGLNDGFLKLITVSLGLEAQKNNRIKILCARYPGSFRDLCNDYLVSHLGVKKKVPEDHPKIYVKNFVEETLRDLYTDKNGQKLPPFQAIKNLRRITFLGYSYGASIIQMIGDCMSSDMKRIGYTDREIQTVQGQMPALIIGPDLTQHYYKNNFQSYHLLTMQDEVVFEKISPVLLKLPRENQDFIRTELKDQKNQHVFLMNDISGNTEETPHNIKTYLKLANRAYRAGNLWKNCVIYNALNNSIQNEDSNRLITLPKQLDRLPKELLFITQKKPLIALLKQAKELEYQRG